MNESPVHVAEGEVDNISIGDGVNSMEEVDMIERDLQLINNEENIQTLREQEMVQEENWTVVGREKRRKIEKINVSISSKEMLPKKFALARLLDEEKIDGIHSVKYVNAFKVIVKCDEEKNAEKLISCQHFKDKEWRIQKTWEIYASYGVIRDIDIGLSDSDLFECIKKCNKVDILSVKRLQRRNSESGWTASETVRICFKGSSRPAYINIFNLRVSVEPYVFPVTQCSRCWRFGHTLKLCPSLKIICPKCTKNHANCETTTFKCVNCRGNHMSLIKSCPAYLKEKQIRQIMSEFNCTYSRAAVMYVPPFSPRPVEQVLDSSYNNTIDKSLTEQVYSSEHVSYATTAARKERPTFTSQSKNASSGNTRESSKRKQRSSSERLAYYEDNESLSSGPNSYYQTTAHVEVHTDTALPSNDNERTGGNGYSRGRVNVGNTITTDKHETKTNKSCNYSGLERDNRNRRINSSDNKSFQSLIDQFKCIFFPKTVLFHKKLSLLSC